MIEDHVPQLSSYAGDIDHLIYLVGWIVMVWFFLALGVFLYFCVRYRAKPGVRALDIDGTNPKHKRWVAWPHYSILAFDVWILIVAVSVWFNVKQNMPQTSETVRVIGQQWAWTFIHAGPDGQLDTNDDIRAVDNLHVRSGVKYKFELQSKDVLHSFSVPVFRLKQDAIPGRTITGWFEPSGSGVFDIQCAEMCGIGHGVMGARIFIETPEQHAKWLASSTPTPVVTLAPAVPNQSGPNPAAPTP